MIYKEFIDNILQTRGRYITEGYKEGHHIQPRCLGGTDADDNIIDLYANEHYIAHKLLALENPNNDKLQYAWHMMHYMSSNEGSAQSENREYKPITAEEYAILKEQWHNTLIGHKHTEKSIQKMRKAKAGKKLTAEHKQHLSESHKNKPSNISDNEREKLRERMQGNTYGLGYKHTEEALQKISAAGHKSKCSGYSWYNNGIEQTRALECHEGWVKGHLPTNVKTKGSSGMRWFNNGQDEVLAYECPDTTYVRGRLKKKEVA